MKRPGMCYSECPHFGLELLSEEGGFLQFLLTCLVAGDELVVEGDFEELKSLWLLARNESEGKVVFGKIACGIAMPVYGAPTKN